MIDCFQKCHSFRYFCCLVKHKLALLKVKVSNKKLLLSRYLIRLEFIKFMFSKKATKIDKIFTIDLTLCSKSQIKGEDFDNFCGLLRKHKLYNKSFVFDTHFFVFVIRIKLFLMSLLTMAF